MSSDQTDYKARLVRFYEKYAPDKLDSVDDLLAKSKGKEEKLFVKLVDKYGPEPEVGSGGGEEVKEKKSKKEKSSAEKSKKKSAAPKQEEEEEVEEEADNEQPQPAKAVDDKDAAAAGAEPTADDYGTRPWWKARLVRFYAKYAPEKTEKDVDALLDKAKDNPNQLLKLFQMLEQKYGPEPEPSSDEEDEEEEEQEEAGDDGEEEEEAMEIPGLKTVSYCPVDGVPPEYSEYFETFEQALPWLAAHYPNLILQTKQGQTVAEYAKAKGVEPLSEGAKVAKSDKAQARKRGGGGKKGEVKIIIEAQEKRKKAITTVKGLENVEGVKLKDVAKMLGKKFASGCSVKTAPSGDDMIEIQGDFSYDLPQILLDFFPAIKKDMVFTVDEDGKKQPAF